MKMTDDWPNRGKGAQPTQVVNRDAELKTTKADMPQVPPRKPDWEEKK